MTLISVTSLAALGLSLLLWQASRQQQHENRAALMQSRAQNLQFQQELAEMADLISGHLGKSLEQRQRQQALESRLNLFESLQSGQQAVSAAKSRLSEGRSLKPLVQRGSLNANEAHLLALVHHQRRSAAAG